MHAYQHVCVSCKQLPGGGVIMVIVRAGGNGVNIIVHSCYNHINLRYVILVFPK